MSRAATFCSSHLIRLVPGMGASGTPGSYYAAYDVWFNQTPTATGQPDGTELMVWLNHGGPVQPFGGQIAACYLISVEAGLWRGGTGLTTSSFSAAVNSGTALGGPAAVTARTGARSMRAVRLPPGLSSRR
jgi:hypothetical protein